MKKRFVQVVAGLAVVAALVLGPIAPGAVSRGGERVFAPARALALRTLRGWDWGGSGGS